MIGFILRRAVFLSLMMLACASITRADVGNSGVKLPSDALMSSRQYMGSTWAVLVFGQDHQLVGSIVVRFTDKKASSCMRGNWRRLEVLKRRFDDKHGSLATMPLSYLFEPDKITLGVTEACDGYVFLRGVPSVAGLTGDYGTLDAAGFYKLGSFAAVRIE